jgi:hypothetical protein
MFTGRLARCETRDERVQHLRFVFERLREESGQRFALRRRAKARPRARTIVVRGVGHAPYQTTVPRRARRRQLGEDIGGGTRLILAG